MTNHKLKVVSKDSDLTDMSDVWDTKNRLLAASYNGYVSSYIYDADGNRMVKLSAPYEAVYTNSTDATVPSDTLRYTLYVGPHYTVTSKSGSEDEEPLYVKHFFIGDKRIASKIGNPPGNDPRGITGVAGKTLHIKVDYPVKYSEQKEQVSANYTNFAMPYSNIDMNHYDYPFNRPGYWNGCVPPNENGTVIVRSADARNGEDANDEEDVSSLRNSPSESSLFFYHTDHLGSTNLVTDRGRSICHAAEYLPYGEVFLEIKGSYDHLGTPFKFNGKEMDPETGMLYYGARYYMPKYCQWPTCDPMQLKYPHVSSYAYCMGNPLRFTDPEGKKIVNADGQNAVYYSGGNIVFTKYATHDIRRIVNVLNTIPEGRKILRQVINSPTKVRVSISSDTRISGKTYTYGETTQGNWNPNDNYGRYVASDGTYRIKESFVEIFEGTLVEDAKTSNSKHKGLTIDQAIGAVAAHEFIHATDIQEINKDIHSEMKKRVRENREIKPNQIERNVINQFLENRGE